VVPGKESDSVLIFFERGMINSFATEYFEEGPAILRKILQVFLRSHGKSTGPFLDPSGASEGHTSTSFKSEMSRIGARAIRPCHPPSQKRGSLLGGLCI